MYWVHCDTYVLGAYRHSERAGLAQVDAGWGGVRGSNLGGARFSALVQTGWGAHPDSCAVGTGSFSREESGRGLELTTTSI